MKVQRDPDTLFEQNESKGGSCPIQNFWKSVSASSTNAELIPLSSGKKHRILIINTCPAKGVAVNFNINSGTSSSKQRFSNQAIDGSTGNSPNHWKAEEVGLCDTDSGESATVTTDSGGAVIFSGRYISLIG